MSRKTPTYAERARTYAIDVVAGRVLACAYVRLACQRHLDDLDAQDDPEFPYRFDTEAVEHVGMFVEAMPHIKGRWVERRERLLLEDWQCFVLAVPFGWVRKSDGLRRYRRVYIEVPRKNGKSSLTAALGLYMFAADGEHGAEVYSGAGSEKQAWEVFGPARLMARGLPDLQEAYGIEVNAKNLSIPESASKFEPIIGKPGDGASPSFSITDEYHEHATDEQYDTMVTGMGAREQPMAWVITTAGSDIAGPCYALRTEVVKALEGSVENDQLFGLVYTLDDGDDWTTEEALRKANPNFGVSVFRDYLLGQQRDAINNVRKQNTFKTKHLNVWVQARDPWMNMELWNRCADAPPISEFAGEPCWLAVDMANKYDIACSAKVFRREMDDGTHYYAYVRSYLPEDQAEAPEKQHYQTWMHDGHLTATDGNIIDLSLIHI